MQSFCLFFYTHNIFSFIFIFYLFLPFVDGMLLVSLTKLTNFAFISFFFVAWCFIALSQMPLNCLFSIFSFF